MPRTDTQLNMPLLDFSTNSRAISIRRFIDLLRNEEDYYPNEQHNTKLMITRLRKIFYDKLGWDKELIRGAAGIEGRYNVEIKEDEKTPDSQAKFSDTDFRHRVVTVKKDDWMNPNAGSVPEIYKDNHQQVILESGAYCDMGHVLAGMDAFNYETVVTPLPSALYFLYPIFPHVNNNADAATWIGDLSSTCGDFLFRYLNSKKTLTESELQDIINLTSPPSDMLGNIDSYVISKSYNIHTANGQRVSEILKDYYCLEDSFFLRRRFSSYARIIGLEGWNGNRFSNEKKWLCYYSKQLRVTSAFYTFSRGLKPYAYKIALKTWLGLYNKRIRSERVLSLLLDSLKVLIKKEPN